MYDHDTRSWYWNFMLPQGRVSNPIHGLKHLHRKVLDSSCAKPLEVDWVVNCLANQSTLFQIAFRVSKRVVRVGRLARHAMQRDTMNTIFGWRRLNTCTWCHLRTCGQVCNSSITLLLEGRSRAFLPGRSRLSS
jgi:hypothetical protein